MGRGSFLLGSGCDRGGYYWAAQGTGLTPDKLQYPWGHVWEGARAIPESVPGFALGGGGAPKSKTL